MSQPRRIALSLVLITLALYLPVAWQGFCVYDDSLYVTENPTVQQGVTWAGVKWAFTSMAASNWHPLAWLSHMVDCGIFGMNPAGPHLVNALIHAVNAALLFGLLLRLTQRPWPAAFIAALFAWHPMHVESVAWISERKDVLSTFFALLALLAYANYVAESKIQGSRARIFYAASLGGFALGLMAKPMLVTLPCVLLLLDFWPLNRFRIPDSGFRNGIRLLAEKVPFFALTAASCLVTFIAQSQAGGKAVVSLGIVSLTYRLKDAPIAYVEYLWKTFWPARLAIFYPLPEKIPVAQGVAAGAVLVCLSVVALRWLRTRPHLFTGWFWFLGMLVPVIGLVQVGGAQLADRYSYLPSVGIFLAVTFAALELAARWRVSGKVLGTLATGLLLACLVATGFQLRHWRSNEALFRHALAVTADNDVARNNLGVALEQQRRFAEAAEQYRAAMRLAPDRYQGFHNYANMLDRLGRHEEALAQHRAAVKLGPEVQFLHNCFAMALESVGQMDEASREYSEAARLDPRYPWPHVGLARICLQQGRDPEAVDELKTALRIAPDSADILAYTARVLAAHESAAIRNGPAAFALAAKANLLTGGTRLDVLDALGMACAELGKFPEAELAARQALDWAAAQDMSKEGAAIQRRLALYQNRQPWREPFRLGRAPVKKSSGAE